MGGGGMMGISSLVKLQPSKTRATDFENQLGELSIEDVSFALSVLRELWASRNRIHLKSGSIVNYLDGLLDSKNEAIRRKTFYIICQIWNSQPGQPTLDWAHTAIDSLVNSETESPRFKLAVFQQLKENPLVAERNLNFYRKGLLDMLTADPTNPRLLATALELDMGNLARGFPSTPSFFRNLALNRLATQESISDEAIDLIPIDLWNGPLADDSQTNPERIKLINLLANILNRGVNYPNVNSTRSSNRPWAIEFLTAEVEVLPKAIRGIKKYMDQSASKLERLTLAGVISNLTLMNEMAQKALEGFKHADEKESGK